MLCLLVRQTQFTELSLWPRFCGAHGAVFSVNVCTIWIILDTKSHNISHFRTLASSGKELGEDDFLKALSKREEDNRSGKMTSIIFIRDFNHRGQEISGYIDYAHRLKTEDFEPYFNGKKKLLPRPSDLRYLYT